MNKFKPFKPVVHTFFDGTEKEYGSITEAALETGVSRAVISNMCNGKRTYKLWRDGSSFHFKHEWHITKKLKI